MKPFLSIIIYCLLMPWVMSAQTIRCLTLPNLEQMPSQRVLCMLQDSEGALWYGTEGGGLCRDDGLHQVVLRNDSEHPTLLGSNNVACLAELGEYLLIGTFHGAYVLDKKDFSIRRLEEVDDKRVDDILVTTQHRVLLTANCKIYAYTSDLQLEATYPSQWQGRAVEEGVGDEDFLCAADGLCSHQK